MKPSQEPASRRIRQQWVDDNQGRFFCQCGCGEPIQIKSFHFTRGVPRFVGRHGGRGKKRSAETRAKLRAGKLGALNPAYGKPAHNRLPPKPRVPCACGCGVLASPGRRYVSGHNVAARPRKPFTVTIRGYHRLLRPEHPLADPKGYILAHRLAVEEHLRQTNPSSPFLDGEGYLRRDVVVHHRDGDKTNNTIENLLPLTNDEHTALHHAQGDIRR